ncbi:hypothetical protein [Serratia sp. JSRIV004]|uniref:hypothetical protein n=1 Tax=Serratia sp. JSRIV004 TaxID=2831895 RepID=UPI001CC0287D|nr:hypothetical protein [Serratia sp. JSRIV004]UAN55355.1 hypothetical protein KGP21_16770 [Serratia sp. JSRIV004]
MILYDKVEALAARRLTEQQIADVMDIDLVELKKDRKLIARFREAIRKGSSKGAADLHNAIYRKARNGDSSAIAILRNVQGSSKDE